MNQLEKFKAHLQSKRRMDEDEAARFMDLLKVGHAFVEYARSGLARKRQNLKLLERVEKYATELMAVTPVYT